MATSDLLIFSTEMISFLPLLWQFQFVPSSFPKVYFSSSSPIIYSLESMHRGFFLTPLPCSRAKRTRNIPNLCRVVFSASPSVADPHSIRPLDPSHLWNDDPYTDPITQKLEKNG
jgi:hypothetical protein